MTNLPIPQADPAVLDPQEHDRTIQARAWAMIEGVLDSSADRLALLHAAAILKATLAMDKPEPFTAFEALLAEHAESTTDLMHEACVCALASIEETRCAVLMKFWRTFMPNP